jgi:hypothetical protein
MISGQSRGKLDNVPASRVKSLMTTYLTIKFDEKLNKCFDTNDIETWYNDILRVETTLDHNNHSLSLNYKQKYIHKSSNFIIENPIPLKSAYSECMKRIINFLKKGKTVDGQEFPFNKITNLDEYESIEVNSIKMGFNSIDKTIDFISKLTCEPPFSSYRKDFIHESDYIMYEGNLSVVRTYNVPDLNVVTQDIGPMPNEIFPSDHLPFIADFKFE